MRMLHFLLMPVAGAWRRHRGVSLFGARWLVLSSIFPAFISLCLFYFLSLWTKVCTSTLDVWWLFGSTDILSNSNHSRGNSKTITLGQPPILYVLHAEWECLVLHMHWGKTIKTGIFAWWCVKTWSRMFFLMTVCCCGVIYTLYLAVLFCVCLPVCFFLCFVSQNITIEIELNVLQLR